MKKLLSLVFGLILSMSSAFAETCDFNISSIYTSGTPTITSAGIYTTDNSQNYIRTQNDVNFSTANTWSFKWRFTYHPATNDQGIMSGNGGTNVQAIINSEGRPRFSFGAGNDTWNVGVWNDTSISFRYQDSVTYDNEIYFNGTRYGFKVDGVEIGGIDSTEKAGNTYFAIGVERGRTVGQYSRAEWDLTNTSLIVDGVNQFLWCQSQIRIATTAYNSARFSPVVTELNDTIATIRNVVTNTINQTKAIADLQATKQTRPDETCPAGKKCLLVEDNAGQPHWYEIIESASRLPDGFTELQYIESTGTQYIDTGYPVNNNVSAKMKIMRTAADGNSALFGYRFVPTASAVGNMRFVFLYADNKVGLRTGVNTTNSTQSISLNQDYVIEYALDSVKVNNVKWVSSSESYSTTSFGNGYLFSTNTEGYASSDINNFVGRIYYFEEMDNGNLVRNLIPVKNSSGVVGMYDTVSGEFFTNKGTGTFVAGPEI